MKTQITLLLFLIAFLLLSTGADALSAPLYQVETGTISGGSYQLMSFGVQAGSIAAGGAYRLLGPSAPNLQGSGCCCTYLPCILRNK
jgi:hypothetical protein